MELQYTVARSAKRKTVTITVERDRKVVVRAPLNASEESIRRIVDSKRQWIFQKLNHPQKYPDALQPPGKEVVNGESAPYLGKDYFIRIVETASGKVEFADEFLVPKKHQAIRQQVLKDWYKEQASEVIMPLVQSRARDLGVTYKAAKIIDSRFRWGSCTPSNCLTFNWRLIKAPLFVINYVIVHELAHLLESNHTARFWRIVRTQVVGMDKAKLWLQEHGHTLEQEL